MDSETGLMNYFPCHSSFIAGRRKGETLSRDLDLSSDGSKSLKDKSLDESSDDKSSGEESSDDESSDDESSGESADGKSLDEEEEYEDGRRPKVRRISSAQMIVEKVDIISLLSSNGRDFLVDYNGKEVSISSIKWKFILVHCFELPVYSFQEVGLICWALKSACSKWPSFQLVVVAKMRKEWENNLAVFNKFLSGFPSCLAIPLWDSVSCNRVFEFVGRRSSVYDALLVDPYGMVLQQHCRFVTRYGVDSLPFTNGWFRFLDDRLEDLSTQRPVPLEKLFDLQLTDFLFSNGSDNVKIRVSCLKEKLVGLYLCYDGFIMDKVNLLCRECQEKSRELVIVLVYLPFSDDPQHFMDSTDAALRDRGISSWWVLPFNDTTSRKLWRLCDYLEYQRDELIIVGPQGKYLEPKAANLFRSGPNCDMYPYAAEGIAQIETARLKKLTLKSLFSVTHGHGYLVTLDGKHVPLRKLRGKSVLLFLANLRPRSHTVKEVEDWFRENSSFLKDSNIVLVFVPLHSAEISGPTLSWLKNFTVSWLICPPDPVREAFIIKHTTMRGVSNSHLSVIAFGEDGRILSIAPIILSERGPDGSLPDQLYRDVRIQYDDIFSNY